MWKTAFKKFGFNFNFTSNFLKTVFHTFYLVCSWIPCILLKYLAPNWYVSGLYLKSECKKKLLSEEKRDCKTMATRKKTKSQDYSFFSRKRKTKSLVESFRKALTNIKVHTQRSGILRYEMLKLIIKNVENFTLIWDLILKAILLWHISWFSAIN